MSKNSWWVAAVILLLLVTPALSANQSKTFEVGSGGSLILNTGVGDVVMSTWGRNQVAVDVIGIDEEDVANLTMTQSGNQVRIDFRPEESSGGVRFQVNLPSRFDIQVKTAGGDVSLDGAVFGTVDLTTAGGDINVGDVDGKVSLKTAGGDVILGTVKADVDVKTAGGDIRVTSADGTGILSTSGGDIVIGNVGRSIKANTSGGDIQVADVGGEASLSTAGGDVKVGKVSGSAKLTTAGGDVILQGATGNVTASTAGGDLKLGNVTGTISGSTAGGDVVATLNPTGKGPSSLSTAGGNVTLYVPDGARARIQATIKIEGRWRANSTKYDIRSDFRAAEYTKDEATEEIRGVYELNGGGDLITLSTVNGDIEIRRGTAPK